MKPEHIVVLHDIVTERAQASLQEIADELYHRCGLRVCDATIRRPLQAQGHTAEAAQIDDSETMLTDAAVKFGGLGSYPLGIFE